MNDTTARSEQYRGFTISVTPQKDNDDLWDFTYRLQREGEPEAQAITRSRTLGGYLGPVLPGWKWRRRKWIICCALEPA